MEETPLLTLNDVQVTLVKSDVQIFNIDSLELRKGSILGIMGRSGDGKSTLLNSIMGLLPIDTFRSTGSIVACTNNQCTLLDQLGEEERFAFNSSFLSFIPQEPNASLNPIRKIGQQLIERRNKKSGSNLRELLISQFKLLSIKDPERLYDSFPHQVSGGQLQRALIASTLISETPLILADEPVSSLDSINSAEIIKILNWIKSTYSKSMIIVSHDLDFLNAISDEILELKNGNLISLPSKIQPLVSKIKSAAEISSLSPLIVLENIYVNYYKLSFWRKSKVKVLKDLSLKIYQGECVGLVGESGSGKSTIARLLSGLLAEYSGRIEIGGNSFEDLNGQARAKFIQMIFQDPYQSLNPKKTIRNILLEVIKKYQTENAEDFLKNLLIELKLDPESMNRYPHQFSGGQRQRIAIARSLSVSPKLLICDEITTNLDLEVQQGIIELLQDLHGRRGMSLLFISHDIKIIKKVADRIIVIKEGRIVEEGPTTHIFSDAKKEYTRKLVGLK